MSHPALSTLVPINLNHCKMNRFYSHKGPVGVYYGNNTLNAILTITAYNFYNGPYTSSVFMYIGLHFDEGQSHDVPGKG